MKRILSPILLLSTAALLFALPFHSRDVGELLPVETALFSVEGPAVVLETDLGLTGRGPTLGEALADLKEKAPGALFLDTGNFILLRPSALTLLPELDGEDFLWESCTLCLAKGDLELSRVGPYLRAHKPGSNLGDALSALAEGRTPALPALTVEDGAFMLEP